MQENKFEKRIQEEMGEFRLRPSDAVWEKVEEQLKKKKRRRVVFFIFMLAGLSLLGYSGYFFTKPNSKQNLVQQDHNSLPDSEKTATGNKQPVFPPIENRTTNDQAATSEIQVAPIKEKNQNEKPANVLSNKKTTIAGNDIAVKHKQRIKEINSDNYAMAGSAGRRNSNKTFDRTKDNTQATENETRQNDRSLNYPVDKANITHQDIAKNNLSDDNKKTVQKDADRIADQKVYEPAKADSVTVADSKTDEAIAATKKKQPGSKIKWGIDLSAGISSSRNNAFSILDIFETNKSLAMDYNSPGNATGGGGLGNIRISPSDIKGGPAFRAGVLAEIQLSKRSSISSGLQYVYHSNNISVGYYSDTTVVVNNSFSQSSRVDAIYRGNIKKTILTAFILYRSPYNINGS